MPSLPKNIKLVYTRDDGFSLEIDGEEFPWYVAEKGVQPGVVSRGEMPTLTVTLLAESIDIEHSIAVTPASEVG